MMKALTPSTIGEGAIQIGRDVDQVTTLSGSSWEQTFELDVRTDYGVDLRVIKSLVVVVRECSIVKTTRTAPCFQMQPFVPPTSA